MLITFLTDVWRSLTSHSAAVSDLSELDDRMKVLNVGGNSKAISIGALYDGWRQDLLDIDPKGEPDLLCDARNLKTLSGNAYDSIYCSHNLEHYYEHDVDNVLEGFLHMLKDDGFVYIRVPDLHAVARVMVELQLDIEDELATLSSGDAVRVKDIIYGYSLNIKKNGNDFYAHKTGFTQKSLVRVLERAGFKSVVCGADAGHDLEIKAIAFKQDLMMAAAPLANSNPILYVGNDYLLKNHLSQAEIFYRYFYHVCPNHIDANFNLGFILLHQDKFDEAERYFIEALEIDQHHTDARDCLNQIKEARKNN